VRSGGSVGTDSLPELFKQFTDSDRFQALRDGAESTGRITLKDAPIPAVVKAALVSVQGGGGAGSFDVEPIRDSRLFNDPRRRLSLLEVLPRMPVASNTYEFHILDGYVNEADFQATEGADKAETAVPTDLQTVPIATIAHHLPTSKQLMDDVPSLTQRIGGLMAYGVLAKLEQAIVSGDGTGGGILGLVPQATAFSSSYSTPVERIGEAIASLDAAGWFAGAILMHPLDWFAIRSERADAGDGQYLAGGWASPASPTAWNVPVLTTPSMPRGEALVMDPSQVAILDHGPGCHDGHHRQAVHAEHVHPAG
jgi:HK97 family phage major capsid protein